MRALASLLLVRDGAATHDVADPGEQVLESSREDRLAGHEPAVLAIERPSRVGVVVMIMTGGSSGWG